MKTGIVTLTASILRICVTKQGTNEILPDDDIEMSKRVGIYYITQRDNVVIHNCALVGCNKNSK